MKALTLHQPWAWAICHAGKRVENRTWAPPKWMIGQRIAIHAGLKFDADAAEFVDNEVWDARRAAIAGRLPLPPVLPVPVVIVHGAIVATAILADARRIEDIPLDERTRWHHGPWCWGLSDVIVLAEPVPCKGRRGLWDTPVFENGRER